MEKTNERITKMMGEILRVNESTKKSRELLEPEYASKVERTNLDRKKFMEDTSTESELQIILRGHIYIEKEMFDLIRLYLKVPNEILRNMGDMTFSNKLSLAVAIGAINKEDKSPFNKLNSLRNNYAHSLNVQISDADFDDFLSTFSKKQKQDFIMTFSDIYESKPTIQKFRLAIVSLWLQLRSYVDNFELDERLKHLEIKETILNELYKSLDV